MGCATSLGVCLKTRPLISVAERGLWSPTLGLYFWQGSSLYSSFPCLPEPPACSA